MKLHVISAAAEFCRETLAWTEQQDPTPLVNGTQDYALALPAQSYALTVRDVWIGGRRLRPMTMHAMQDAMPNWATITNNEPIYYNAATERGLIRLFPIPANAVQSLVIRAAFVPAADADSLPDFLGQRYMDVITSGAKARLMQMPGVPWSNPQLAAYYRQMFDNGVVSARIDEAHDRVPGTITVRSRSFGF